MFFFPLFFREWFLKNVIFTFLILIKIIYDKNLSENNDLSHVSCAHMCSWAPKWEFNGATLSFGPFLLSHTVTLYLLIYLFHEIFVVWFGFFFYIAVYQLVYRWQSPILFRAPVPAGWFQQAVCSCVCSVSNLGEGEFRTRIFLCNPVLSESSRLCQMMKLVITLCTIAALGRIIHIWLDFCNLVMF